MGLFLYLGIDLGSPDTFYDDRLFDSMTFAFLLGTFITAFICYGLAYFAGWVTRIPYVYYFPFILAVIVWATLQYTGGWEDLAVLIAFSILGFISKSILGAMKLFKLKVGSTFSFTFFLFSFVKYCISEVETATFPVSRTLSVEPVGLNIGMSPRKPQPPVL